MQPIDYARADADVVRKKFRRRVVMFVFATIVVTVIGCGWIYAQKLSTWLFGSGPYSANSIAFTQDWIAWFGPARKAGLNANWPNWGKVYGNKSVGIVFVGFNYVNYPKWSIQIRYRTLFILAMIPWIITLIRLIRVWKQKHMFEKEPRTK